MRSALMIGMAAALGASPLPAAQTPVVPTAAADPNAKICEMITVTGSRLGSRRICATRAQWESVPG